MKKTKKHAWHLHDYLDKYFHQRLSFSVFFRIWFAIALVILLIGMTSFYALQKTIRPSAKRVVEDTLADTSRLLSVLVADDVAKFLANPSVPLAINFYPHEQKTLWYDQKTNSQFHLYITDRQGVVLYDSWQKSLGADFSRWNDVYLTLQGKYGARSTDVNGSSVMYVASPIMHQGKLIGVVSVGKPTATLAPYLEVSEKELIKILLQSMAFSLIIALFIAMWLRHSIASINRYTQSLANSKQPHFYLANEFNELVANIKQMKDAIENKAYVTDYVHTLTHELKSPLSAIRASSELLADEIDSDDRVFFSKLITTQSERMASLIDRLLVLAKLEQPNFQLKKETVLPINLAKDCLACHTKAYQEDIATIIVSSDTPDFTYQADPFWLTQAIQNVVDNAMFHSLSWVGVIADGAKLYIVNDSNVMPDYVFERAFERYFSFCKQNKADNKQSQKGTGLGLPLVAQIMHHHHAQATLYQCVLGDFYPQISPNTQAQLRQFCQNLAVSDTCNVVVMVLDFTVID